MAKHRTSITPAQLDQILACIPEGFIPFAELRRRFKLPNPITLPSGDPATPTITRHIREIFYDSTRLSAGQVVQLATRYAPSCPDLNAQNLPNQPPIVERRDRRREALDADPDALALLDRLAERGYIEMSTLMPAEAATARQLVDVRHLAAHQEWLYDPLMLGHQSLTVAIAREHIEALSRALVIDLEGCPGQTMAVSALPDRYRNDRKTLLMLRNFALFDVSTGRRETAQWVRLAGADSQLAEQEARRTIRQQKADARQKERAAWTTLLARCGDVVRPDSRPGKTPYAQVCGRSYTVPMAAKRLGIREKTLWEAIRQLPLDTLKDPRMVERLTAETVERAGTDPDYGERIAGFEQLKTRHIALVSGVVYSTARGRLVRANVSTTKPTWAGVRGQWGLPDTLNEFKTILKPLINEWRNGGWAREKTRAAEEQDSRRALLAGQIRALFPDWQHDPQIEQRFVLHVGPTNSGKTHTALARLIEAGSGWYLAPLRLLAYEIFDTLNKRGVPCNLLTGERYIPVEGARFTAATIEMFDPAASGRCVIIDEAHMLADPQRGAAWTQALLEARAPEVHIIGPPIVRDLTERLADAFGLSLTVIEHDRLTPLRVADQPWSLDSLPPHTILIAFSRQTVLALKDELERMNRPVSVIYGALPPEVRRRQAERFADGKTDVCVATDAVGMGLNLPADNVCFYELTKFDGQKSRQLTPREVHQIGGRAGRFGLSHEGIIGALDSHALTTLHHLYTQTEPSLTHARIAPMVDALNLIPGSLATRLQTWERMDSIPDTLRALFNPADLSEPIALADYLDNTDLRKLGLTTAWTLVNAPTRPDTRPYWYNCLDAILSAAALPLPYSPRDVIINRDDLRFAETCVQQGEIYLWLGRRQAFHQYALDTEQVQIAHDRWALQIDDALQRQIDTARRCSVCGKRLPPDHRYSMCEACHAELFGDFYDDDLDDNAIFSHSHSKPSRKQARIDRDPNQCPLCRQPTPARSSERLEHWQAEHSGQREVTITYAAWLTGLSKDGLPQQIPFDRLEVDGNTTVRYWKIDTLADAIARRSAIVEHIQPD